MAPALDEIRARKRELDRKMREAEKLAGKRRTINEQQSELMTRKRALERDTTVRDVLDWDRREAGAEDIYFFMGTYFPAFRGPGLNKPKYAQPFTTDRRRMVEALFDAAMEGRDQAIAAPRGEGKSAIIEAVTIHCLLRGVVKFPVLIAANGPDAERILNNIKSEFERNDILAQDWPEVCDPCRALEGAAQRANMQTVRGKRTWLRWGQHHVVFAAVDASPNYEDGKSGHPASAAGGSILMTRGLDAAIRGINVFGNRPDLIVLDDLETRESAKSPPQILDRELTIEQDIAGLDAGGKIGKVILCTTMNRTCLSWKYTDPKEKTSWNGQRYRLLIRKPDAEDLWDEYCKIRQDGMAAGEDREGAAATAFYVERREQMDAGAEVSNPYRFVDGKELSALQHCYNIIADRGWNNFATEYQNDPPEEDGPQESGITSTLVASRVNGFARRVLPATTSRLTAFLDLSDTSSHWVVVAWLEGCIGCVVDYGILEGFGVSTMDPKTKARTILDQLHRWRLGFQHDPFRTAEGIEKPIDLALIDSGDGDHTDACYAFCQTVGAPYMPAKGKAPWSAGQQTQERRVGNHWYTSIQRPQGLRPFRLFVHDADHWKRFVHERFLTETLDQERRLQPGALSLFAPADKREHHTFSHHIVAEVWRVEFREGKGVREGWYARSKNNHYLDGAAGNCAAADMLGIRLLSSKTPRKKFTLAELAARGA